MGGVSKIALELASAQSALGHNIEIATIRAADEPVTERYEGVLIRRFDQSRFVPRPYSRSLVATLKGGQRPDVIHTHNTFLPLNISARLLAKTTGAAYFTTPHGTLDPVLLHDHSARALKKRLYISAVERRNFNAADAMIVNTDDEANWARASGVEAAIRVIPNGARAASACPPELVAAFRRRWNLPSSGPCVLYVGRLVPKKQVREIVAAFAELYRASPNSCLLLAGSRDEDASYVRRIDADIAALGLAVGVRWLGHVDEDHKAAAYANATVFVHASLSEGMPMAVLEAMGAGLPCVVTPGTKMTSVADQGGVREVALGDLGAEIAAFVADERARSRIAAQGFRLATTQFSWTYVAQLICEVYEEAIARHGR